MKDKEQLRDIIREVIKEVLNPYPDKKFVPNIKIGNKDEDEQCSICGTDKDLIIEEPFYYCSRCEETFKIIEETYNEFQKKIENTVRDILSEFHVSLFINIKKELKRILP